MPDAPATDGARHGDAAVVGRVPIDAPQFDVAAKHPDRAAAVIAAAFFLSLAGFVGFGAAYWQNAANYWLGITLGVAMLAFGYGLAAWGKYLMPRGPFEEPRQMMQTTKEEKDLLVADFAVRGRVAVKRRGFLVKFMGAAAGVFGVVALFPLIRSLGPLPDKTLYKTKWKKGAYLTSIDGKRIKVGDLEVGGIVTVFPENDVGGALSQTVLLHVQKGGDIVTVKGRETWAPQGFIAFSKVCTHAGCPVGLYEELTQQLLCPCHQSLFDIYAGAIPVFGPAPRPLPQLPLYIDSSGFIRAQSDYDEPIGPGFWTRGGT